MRSAEPPSSKSSALAAFRHRGYRLFWVGALVSSTGTWLGNLTIPFVLYQQTQSAVWIGLAVAAQFAPALFTAPLGGWLADTRDRRLLLIASQSALGVVAVLMWVQWAAGLHSPVLLLILLTIFGIINGTNNPAWQALVNDLVPREAVASAVTFNSLQFNLARAIGPAIAGVLLATLGATWGFFVNAASFVIVVIVLLFVRTHSSRTPQRSVGRMGAQLREAVLYVGRSRSLMLAITLCCVVGLFGNPVFTLTVVVAEQTYATGPIGLGILTASLGAGAVLYAVAQTIFGTGRLPLSRRIALAISALGGSLLLFAVAPTIQWGVAAGILVGASFLAAFAGLNTAIQLLAPDQLRGRILALRHMVFSVSIAGGVLAAGFLTDTWDVSWALTALGCVLIITVVCVAVLPGSGFMALDDANGGHDNDGRTESDSTL